MSVYLSIVNQIRAIEDKQIREASIALAISEELALHPSSYNSAELKLFYSVEYSDYVMSVLSKINELEYIDIVKVAEKVYSLWGFASKVKNTGRYSQSLDEFGEVIELLMLASKVKTSMYALSNEISVNLRDGVTVTEETLPERGYY